MSLSLVLYEEDLIVGLRLLGRELRGQSVSVEVLHGPHLAGFGLVAGLHDDLVLVAGYRHTLLTGAMLQELCL